jgi:hypothetical protein
MLAHDQVRTPSAGEAPVRDREAPVTWPPRHGQLWLAAERWPATALEAEIPGGAWVTIMEGEAAWDPVSMTIWWRGEVLGPNGVTFIKAIEGDLIPGDDPRLQAQEFSRAA